MLVHVSTDNITVGAMLLYMGLNHGEMYPVKLISMPDSMQWGVEKFDGSTMRVSAELKLFRICITDMNRVVDLNEIQETAVKRRDAAVAATEKKNKKTVTKEMVYELAAAWGAMVHADMEVEKLKKEFRLQLARDAAVENAAMMASMPPTKKLKKY